MQDLRLAPIPSVYAMVWRRKIGHVAQPESRSPASGQASIARAGSMPGEATSKSVINVAAGLTF